MRSHVHLTTQDLTKGYESGPVVDGVSLKVSAGQRLGIIGENGRGKTTLLRLLAGDLAPDQGTVTRHGSLSLVRQEMPFQERETVGDLLDEALRVSRLALSELDSAAEPFDEPRYERALAHAEDVEAWDAERRAGIALKALDADHDRATPLATLSVGQRYRVRLACLLAERADVLLLDEPTNHLDAAALGFLTERLRQHPGVTVLVSHDRALLDDVCTQLLDLDPTPDGEVRLHGGGYRAFKEAKRAERQRWEQRFAQEAAEHDELADRVERAQSRLQDAWRPPKGAFKHKRGTRAANKMRTVARRLEELDDQRVAAPPPPLRFTPPELTASGDLLHATPLEVPGRLVLDEPTNHLSIALVDELTEALLRTRAAVAVATHDRQMRTDFDRWRTVILNSPSRSRESSVASEQVLY